jgi:hypothetical protein
MEPKQRILHVHLDPDLYIQASVARVRAGMTWAEWLTLAIEHELSAADVVPAPTNLKQVIPLAEVTTSPPNIEVPTAQVGMVSAPEPHAVPLDTVDLDALVDGLAEMTTRKQDPQ